MNGHDQARLTLMIGAALAMEFFTYTWVLWGIAAVTLYVADYWVRRELKEKTLKIVELESKVYKYDKEHAARVQAQFDAHQAKLEAEK